MAAVASLMQGKTDLGRNPRSCDKTRPLTMAALLDAHESLVNPSLRVELSHAVSPQSSIMVTSAESTAASEGFYNVASLGSAGTLQFNSAAISAAQDLKGQTGATVVLSDTTPITMASLSGAGTTVESGVAIAGSTPELAQVFTGLHQSEELSSVLRQQPQLVQDLSAIAAGDVSADPESLRFQYSVEEEVPKEKPPSSKKTVYKEQDRFLPIANVARIMRNAIPRNGKVSKDAKECMQECVSEFVSFITSEACDKCTQEKRKTITGDDILFAMATLGFDNYIEPLKLYLLKYRVYTRDEKMATTRGVRNNAETAGDESMQQSSSAFESAMSAQMDTYSTL